MSVEKTLDLMNDPSRRSQGVLFGKYRGMVTDNKDPLKLGRVQVTVPAVPGMTANWAEPCAPYAGKQVGFYTIPPVGAKVWVEFEGGNPDFPIWSGCFWQASEVPSEVATNAKDPSQVKVLKTRVATFWIDDTDQKGKVTLKYVDSTVSDPVTVTLLLDAAGLTITCEGKKGTSKLTMTPETITTSSDTLSTTSNKSTTVTAKQDLTATVQGNTKVESGGNINTKATGDMTCEGTNVTARANNNLMLSANNAATLRGNASVTVQASGSATFSGQGTVTISSTASTKVSGAASLSLGGAAISFAPA